MKFNYLQQNILLGILILIILALLSFNLGLFSYFGFWIFIFYVALILVVFLIINKRTNNFLKGQEGEWEVDKILKKLGPDFKFYENGIDTEHGNIDKLVIGPAGIWTIEVKNDYPNLSLFEKHVNQAYSQKKFIEDLISKKLGMRLAVIPLLIFVNDKYKPIKSFDKGVRIIKKEDLNSTITKSKEYFLTETTQAKVNNLLASI